VLQLEQDVLQLEQKKTEKNNENVEKVKNEVLNSYDPEFFVGKIVKGIKITKKLLKEWGVD
jgi:hypothetical protein